MICQLRKTVNCTCGNPQAKIALKKSNILVININSKNNGVQSVRHLKSKNDGFLVKRLF